MSTAASGSVLLPRTIMTIALPAFCGAWVGKDMKSRCWQGLLFTGLVIVVANLMMSFNSTSTPLMVFFVAMGLTGIAESFYSAVQMPIVQGSLTAENMGSGMSLSGMMGTLSSSVSGCIYGIILNGVCPAKKTGEGQRYCSSIKQNLLVVPAGNLPPGR